MIPEAIRKEILIEAPVEVVWELITEPAYLRRWFTEDAEIELRAGGAGTLLMHGTDAYHLVVEAVEPPRRFAFRWVGRPDVTVPDRESLLVEFTLEPESRGTRLRLVESGFDRLDWTEEEMAKYADDHSSGWQRFLLQLRDLAAAEVAARG